ncbi:phage tail protein [Salinicoccus carnicancri]|uniref:phage tail protein n=1 Tax=Salinicoccus carnicancri TaxID=558170 RepID=UPI000302EA3F|nr:phage tail protein [Salinicoccus carnicancri]
MLSVKSLDGRWFPAEAQVPRTRVIGEREISLSFLHSEINDVFLSEIETGWIAEFQGDEYWLYNPQEDIHGNKSFECLFDLVRQGNKVWHIDDVEDKSMTIENSIGPLFNDLPDYTLQIIDNFYANTMNYSNRQTTTERFLYFIERHEAEFEIPIGSKTVQIRNEVGTRRDDLMIHEDDNLIDLQLNTQDDSFCTTVTGYYDFDDEGNPQKSVIYRSSLADKYGDIPGEPILDDRYNNRDAVYEAARKRQESSYQLSFEVSSELFETPVNEGDYVPLVIPSKSINMHIRVVEINELFDEDENLIEATYSFGNENISQLYRKAQYDALMDVNDILRGKKPLPPSVLPKAFKRAFEVIRGDDDSVIEYRKDRLIGHHDKNAGNAVELNVSGLQFIRNGNPRSAITYEGVVTEALTAGTIDTNRIRIVGAEGFFYISGDELIARDYNNPEKWTEIRPSGVTTKGSFTNLRPDYFVDSNGKEWGKQMEDGLTNNDETIQRNQFIYPDVTYFSGQRYYLNNAMVSIDSNYTIENCHFTHNRKFLKIGIGINMEGDSGSNRVLIDVVEISTGQVVESVNEFIRAADSTKWLNITFEMGVPDYVTEKAYQIRIGSTLRTTTGTLISAIINRVSQFG